RRDALRRALPHGDVDVRGADVHPLAVEIARARAARVDGDQPEQLEVLHAAEPHLACGVRLTAASFFAEIACRPTIAERGERRAASARAVEVLIALAAAATEER